LQFNREKWGNVDVVIDGQQRLTSLANVLLFKHTIVDERKRLKWALHFDLKTGHFVFPNNKTIPQHQLFPMSVVADTLEYLNWIKSLGDNQDLIDMTDNVAKAIRDYKMPVYRVDSNEEEVREIFDRLNSMGKALHSHDIFHAIQQMSNHHAE